MSDIDKNRIDNTKVLIVDDEPLARQRLAKMVSELKGYTVAGEAGEAIAAIGLMEKYQPDLVLLDISMPGMSGIDLAHRFSEMNRPPAVIFCTAHDEYALEAFKTSAIGYLMKPIRLGQLVEQLNKASNLNSLQLKTLLEVSDAQDGSGGMSDIVGQKPAKKHLTVRSHRGVEMLELTQICFFSSEDKYVVAHHNNTETILEQSLKALEEEFSDLFIRIHRNALVSIQHIRGLERRNNETYVRLKDTDSSPVVSRRHLKKLKDLMASL